MVAKHPAPKKATPDKPKSDPNTIKVREGENGISREMTESQIKAKLATTSSLTASALKSYAGFGEDLDVTDLMDEMRAAGGEVVGGNLGRVERMLTNQAMVLDSIFANLAERSSRQEYMKNKDIYLRLALKAQSQCRATAEALALLKNPQPYIRQANIANGHQQVNNSYAGALPHTGIPASDNSANLPSSQTLENNPSPAIPGQQMRARAGAGKLKSSPSKLLS